tara:strand:+ start:4145 stop:4564 length:420 start_codon:yes stop_codon:yes gene_type:complete
MATVNVTLSLSSTDLFAKQTLSFTETDTLSPAGDQMLVGRLVTTGSGTEDNIALKALDGTNDRAYVFLHNLSTTTGEYVKIGLCAAHGTDSASGDWFAVLGPGEFMFMPIGSSSGFQDIDIEAAAGNPVVEYVLMEKAA